jgi:uncharacterized membrane protein
MSAFLRWLFRRRTTFDVMLFVALGLELVVATWFFGLPIWTAAVTLLGLDLAVNIWAWWASSHLGAPPETAFLLGIERLREKVDGCPGQD